jgi:hypothetical protein
MTGKVYLLDHENQAKADLSVLAEHDRVILFLGETSSVNRELFNSSMRLGTQRVTPVNIAGTGKNALDFHLAYYLGELLTKDSKTRCVIVSKDKGFTPLVRHLQAKGFSVERVDTLSSPRAEIVDQNIRGEDALFIRARESLKKGDKKARPRKLSTLQKHLKSILNGKASEDQILQVVDRLIEERVVHASGETVTYPE